MNNRCEIAYRLQREGFGEIQVGWERVYDLTPMALKEIVESQSLIYDKPLSFSFPEWWKNDKEAFLPSVILNNIFGIVPDYDYKQDFTGIRLVNLATNEVMETFPGDEVHLLFICKRILTYCKKVLRSWGKEPHRLLRYGTEYLRDKWHIENYPDAFQRPDVRIYNIVKYNRLTEKECLRKANWIAEHRNANNTGFDHFDFYHEDDVYSHIKSEMLSRIGNCINDYKPDDFELENIDLEKVFGYLFDKDVLINVYQCLGRKTHNNYTAITYVNIVASAALSGFQRTLV